MQKSYGTSIPEKEKIQTNIDSLRDHIYRDKNDESVQEDDEKPRAETKHMQTVNEFMELMMNENKAKKEEITGRKHK